VAKKAKQLKAVTIDMSTSLHQRGQRISPGCAHRL
jgi:hypothetical protein